MWSLKPSHIPPLSSSAAHFLIKFQELLQSKMKPGGNTIVIWMYAVATWLCFGSTSGWSFTLEDNNIFPKQYPIINFTTADATVESYTNFIRAVRSHLTTGGDVRHEIPVLPNRVGLPISQRFILVELSNHAELSVTLALDVTNAYVVGCRAGNSAYFFHPDNQEDAEAITHLFTDVQNSFTFAFGGNYDRLEQLGGLRENIELGTGPLEDAISALYYYSTCGTQIPTLARSFMVCIQMISEAARFQYIEGEMRTRIRYNRRSAPDPSVITLENSWGRLSTAIQESNQGAFASPIQLQRRNGSKFNVYDVSILIPIIALMVYRCAPPPSSQFSLLIRPVVPNFNADVCMDPEPIVRIVGRNGLCVDVTGEEFFDGNPIQLWPCKSNTDWNQLWTLRKDSTIRSNGKCLTISKSSPGQQVVIYNCSTATVGATRWQIWDNRTIINPTSGLVLAATSGNSGTKLTVQTNIYAVSQGWLPTNNTQPFVTTIVGLYGMCLQANSGKVWLEDCTSEKAEQQWALYADGSIRPQQNRDNCLTTDANIKGTVVKILSCGPASSGQRWMFKNDGTILNLYNGLVLDVRRSDPSLKQIIVHPVHGNLNQIWLPLF